MGAPSCTDNSRRLTEPLRCHACGQEAHLRGIYPDVALDLAAKRFALAAADIAGPSQYKPLVTARTFVVWSLSDLGKPLSYAEIGRLLNRGHASISYLHDKARGLLLTDDEFALHCLDLTRRFYAARDHEPRVLNAVALQMESIAA